MPGFPNTQTSQPAGGGFDIGKFLQMLLLGSRNALPQVNLGQQLAGIHAAKDPQGAANRGYIPGAMQGQMGSEYSPFANGFFQSHNQRIGNETAQLGQDGITGVQAGLAPMQHNPDAAARFPVGSPVATPEPQQPPVSMAIPRRGGGVEGMINPNLPDSQKYGDSNFWSAILGPGSLPKGAVAGDGKTKYKRAGKPGNFGQSFLPAF